MKICSICKGVSASGEDHIHCLEMKRIRLEADYDKEEIAEKISLGNTGTGKKSSSSRSNSGVGENSDDDELARELRGLLDYMYRQKSSSSSD